MGVRIQELPETTGINKEDVLIVEDGQGTKKGTVQQLDEALGVSQLKEDLDEKLPTSPNLYNSYENTFENVQHGFLQNGTFKEHIGYCVPIAIKVKPNEKYTFNFKPWGTLNDSFGIHMYNENGAYVGMRNLDSNLSFTNSGVSYGIKFTINANSEETLKAFNDSFMMVEGESLPSEFIKYGFDLGEYCNQLKVIDNLVNDVKEELSKVSSKAYYPCCIRKSTDLRIEVFFSKYSNGFDLDIMLNKKGLNGLLDFNHWFKISNNSDVVSHESNPSTRIDIVSSDTDWIAPYVVYAVNNDDGDFPNLTDSKFTGGWHGYNNATSGSAKPTARTVSVKIFADGVELTENGTYKYCFKPKIVWTNFIQGSNTEKADGSGREILKETVTVEFDTNGKANVTNEIEALEDVKIRTYYGLQCYNGQLQGSIFYKGCRTNRHSNPYNTLTRNGDLYCNGIIHKGTNDTFEIGIDSTIDLGSMYANKGTNSALTTTAQKSYMVLVDGGSNNEMLELSQGDKVYFKGYYNIYPTN